MNNVIKRLIFLIAIILISALVVCFLLSNGYIWFVNPDPKLYPIRGIDVSHHQNEIDWDLVKSDGIDFVYIKATEGKGFIDHCFKSNWENAIKAGLKVGAYHFYSFRFSGAEQAGNFIKIVPREEVCLPPAIDIEFGGNSSDVPDKADLARELNIFINRIEEYYGQEPIIYTLYDSYENYIKGSYKDNKIWIRDIFKYPKISDNCEWTFWQYCNRGRIKGINGFVDLNVFSGNNAQLDNLLSAKTGSGSLAQKPQR